jgi:hypothetical protein
MIAKEKHQAAKDLHSPGTLAKLGIEHGAGYFLGPFGFGVKAVEFIHKNGGNIERGAAVDLLAEEHTEEVHQALLDALTDKDFVVRAAAAKGLAQWPGKDTADHLRPLFDDDRTAVRLTAAAAYIRVYDPHPSPEKEATAPHVIREVPPHPQPSLHPGETPPAVQEAPAPPDQPAPKPQ